MSVQPTRRYGFFGAVGFCLTLVLALSLGNAYGQGSPASTGAAPVDEALADTTPDLYPAGLDPLRDLPIPLAWSGTGGQARTVETLREQLARDGSVRVRVHLRLPTVETARLDATQRAIWLNDLEQAAQDLLAELPSGAEPRAADSAILTLQVDAAGLERVLLSPSVATVAAASNSYFTEGTINFADGTSLDEYTINGPPVPPPGYQIQRSAVDLPEASLTAGVYMLTVPAFDWSFGCSATAGAMIAAYYDRNEIPNMYIGPTNGGVIPLDSSSWPYWVDGSGSRYAQCPLTASHLGLDGRTTRGSIDDYWVEYNSSASDPYVTNGWSEHAWGDAIGDYMKTSQSAYGNTDGSTTFYNWTSSTTQLTCNDMVSYNISAKDGTYGRKLFYEAKGYTVTDCYNQRTDNNGGGFTFTMYKTEIDAGRPVILNLAGHSIVGVGYDSATSTVYLHDTWDYNTHAMTWGGSYSGMALLSVSIVNLGEFSPSPPAPDFVVTSVALTPASPSANGTFSATVTVKNQGTAAGAAGTLQVWADQAVAQGCSAVGDKSATLSSIPAGSSATVTVNGVPAGVAGAKTLRAFVDSQCLTTETDETDNQYTAAYTVLPAPTPDFVVTNVILTPASPSANGTFSARVTVKNQGAAAGAAGTLQVWANQPDVQNCSAVGDKTATLPTIVAGGTTTVTVSGLSAGAAGAKTLRAFVDSKCLAAETDEDNNQYAAAYTVLPAPTPDLIVTSVALTPASPSANGTFSAKVTVKNQGTVAGTAGTLQVWANQPDVQVCSAVGDKSATLYSIAAGASTTVTVSGLPAGVAGAKTLRAFVDSKCLTAETDETNNQYTVPYNVAAAPTPDFVVTNVTLSPASPKANATFSATVTVKNQGPGSGNGGYLDIWTNQPADQTCPADGNAYASVGTLAGGASKTVTVSGLRSGATSTKTLRALVDSYCQTTESDDGNNQFVKGYSVIP